MKKYLFCVLMVFLMCMVLLGAVTLIIAIPELREGFNKFFNTTAMTWKEAREMILQDCVLCIPFSFIFGFFFMFFMED